MPVSKEDIRTRIRVVSKWITSHNRGAPTEVFTAVVPERTMRYIVMMAFPGDFNQTQRMEIMKTIEAGTYETKWCPIPIAAADYRQIPEGSYSIEDPVITLAGGENLAASIEVAGTSLNLTCIFWDADI